VQLDRICKAQAPRRKASTKNKINSRGPPEVLAIPARMIGWRIPKRVVKGVVIGDCDDIFAVNIP
jgi:hypothetical protein